MGGPEHALLPASQGLLRLPVEWAVPAPGVDSHHTHAPVVEPAGRLGGHRTAPPDIIRLTIEVISPRPDEHDVERLEVVPEIGECGLQVPYLDLLAVGLACHVEDHAVGEEPLQRQFVDRGGPLSPDHAVVVPGGIDVRDAVGRQLRELFDRPALVVSQEVRRNFEHRLDLGCPLGVGRVIDLNPLEREGVGAAGGDRG